MIVQNKNMNNLKDLKLICSEVFIQMTHPDPSWDESSPSTRREGEEEESEINS